MYATYTDVKTGLSGDDIAGIRALYGARRRDSFDAAAANNKSSIAAGLAAIGANGRINAFTNFFYREVRGVRAKGAGRKAYEN